MASQVKRSDQEVQQAAGSGRIRLRSRAVGQAVEPQRLTDVFGKRVRARRADLGYSQEDLADYMRERRGHRWTHGTVSRIETGQAEPTLSELVSLMFILQASFAELLDPVVTGGGPVDIGIGGPRDAEYARKLMAGEVREHVVFVAPASDPTRGEG